MMAPSTWILLLYVLLAAAVSLNPAQAVSLERDVGKPASNDWDAAIAWVNSGGNNPLLTPLLNVFKEYEIPSCTIGIQVNPNRTAIDFAAPAPGTWQTGQVWWMAGWGRSYRSPMRVASVSKPITIAVWQNICSRLRTPGCLRSYLDNSFYTLWEQYVGDLPEPKDSRVYDITVKHLIDHTSGFDNKKIGFDPAFKGKSVTTQIGAILESTDLLADPGTKYSYSNFGFMILARLAQGMMGKTFITLVRQLFPTGPKPIYGALDTIAISGAVAGAPEPNIYYVQSPDKEFDVSVMAGNGNIVTNVVMLSWFGTQYWIGGATLAGKKFTTTGVLPGYVWLMNGGMPGTMSALVQYTTPKKRVASIAIIINTRVPNSDPFYTKMNAAAIKYLQDAFKDS